MQNIAKASLCSTDLTQFNPQVGDVQSNIDRAEAILADSSPSAIDVLILPEMAFSGKSE